ncbi:MAG: hypothetical protein ACXVLQ_19310, partial [Bacteriovorax sp.]
EAQDQALMNRVEDLSKQDPSNEHVIDSVSVENAATSRPEEGPVDPKPAPITQESPSLKKSRRIRSR